MCGIAGILGGPWETPAREQAISRMQAALHHRGPDDLGTWIDGAGTAALTYSRLAIQDLSAAGQQPMALGDLRTVFNGEIYNFHELREALEKEGDRFVSRTDTEVLLHLWKKEGSACLNRLRGMFAFAMYNAATKEAALVRDPFGIKPLYYAEVHGGLLFASELRALLASGLVQRKLNASAAQAMLEMGSVPEPVTMVEGIHLLEAGQCLSWCEGKKAQRTSYGKLQFSQLSRGEELSMALSDSLRAHLVSDAPVGLFLSGGIDSTAVASAASKLAGGGIDAFTLTFDHPDFCESDAARITAAHYGLRHHEERISLAQGPALFEEYLASLDQPTVDGFNIFCVSRMAQRHGIKVILSGLGGDEMFGGYPSFNSVPQWTKWAKLARTGKWPARTLGKIMQGLPSGRVAHRLGEWMERPPTLASAYRLRRQIYTTKEARQILLQWGLPIDRAVMPETDLTSETGKEAVAQLEIENYLRNQLLRDADVMTMAHGLELRVPLLDRLLFEAIRSIPPQIRYASGKQALIDAAGDFPQELLSRPKRGFAVPFEAWLKSDPAAWKRFPFLTEGTEPWFRRMACCTLLSWIKRNEITA